MTTHSAKEARNKKSRKEEEVEQNLKKEGGGGSNIGGTFIKYGVKPSANLAVYELNSLQRTIF